MILGFFIGKRKPKLSALIALPLIKYGIPLSVMGLLLKEGIDLDLIKTALIAFLSIGFLIILINYLSIFKTRLPNYSLQLAGLIGNTSFLGIPIALALLPTSTINFTIGFDLGTTLFAWIFGPFFLKKRINTNTNLNFNELLKAILNSPASRGIVGVLIVYLLGLEKFLGDYLWIPARIVIVLAIVVVGTRLGIITNSKTKFFNLNKGIKYSIILKLLIFPLFIFVFSKILGFNLNETSAVVLQAGTPSAVSTILLAEAYKTNQKIAATILFTTTLISIITIPVLANLIKTFQ
ncbi:ABC transporter family-like [Prochlorococcus marinus str. EQPAC1]|nr:AEC family transporter [Prochlorococcus marinus]KGF87265.1 ABC transporter family-like [Prochlorococcus marinus str. EQPAC1]